MSERPPKFSIPLKRIERLIALARNNKLAVLEVGHIRIVPDPSSYANADPAKSNYEKAIEKLKPGGKPLTPRQREDLILFGPKGTEEGELEDLEATEDDAN